MELQEALNNPKWVQHQIGDTYLMINRGGDKSDGWKIAYYPLFGTYKNGEYVEFNEPRVLIERPMEGGTDFREVAFRYLNKTR